MPPRPCRQWWGPAGRSSRTRERGREREREGEREPEREGLRKREREREREREPVPAGVERAVVGPFGTRVALTVLMTSVGAGGGVGGSDMD